MSKLYAGVTQPPAVTVMTYVKRSISKETVFDDDRAKWTDCIGVATLTASDRPRW